ncbi:MAG: type II toxin-antitoxin system RelE/ParE family toxin [Thiohalocapsa sp. PB-PSB1]|nr:MAG: type II toxin-antitoxin system RelE/ParE family toxin [Thiohalocapsa sp. PB-PSB1]HCS91631.1 type II toxin-antitoxin system RelE/ParE family toxin [Chromatiaceae bacterium]
MNNVAFDSDARAEFLAAVRYYEEFRKGLGLRFRQTVEAQLGKIREMPFRFRVLRAPFRRCVVPKFPYAIVYTIEPEFILVVAVAHNKRQPEYWNDRVDTQP